eukprot:2377696-Rhodomonas_salina.1
MSCSDVRTATDKDVCHRFVKGSTLMIGITIDSPDKKQIGKSIRVPMSSKYSMRTAIAQSIPSARI